MRFCSNSSKYNPYSSLLWIKDFTIFDRKTETTTTARSSCTGYQEMAEIIGRSGVQRVSSSEDHGKMNKKDLAPMMTRGVSSGLKSRFMFQNVDFGALEHRVMEQMLRSFPVDVGVCICASASACGPCICLCLQKMNLRQNTVVMAGRRSGKMASFAKMYGSPMGRQYSLPNRCKHDKTLGECTFKKCVVEWIMEK